VLLWPAGMALVTVWLVFRDPAIDHRVLLLGAVLPDLVDAPFGGARLLHTLAASAALLVAVMLLTRRTRSGRSRRHLRRRWLFLPVGTFLHLVFDGMWARGQELWWPVLGGALDGPLPALDHGVAVLALQEVAGALALLWCWRRFGLAEPQARASFLRTGRLPRDLAQ
jgi:membrane-bound metal-dependent hydrolase YbcI (DUF457 family)